LNDERKKQIDTLVDVLGRTICASENKENKVVRMNAVYCLSLISYNESSILKLLDHADHIREIFSKDQVLK
jgi:hypothetical protein